MAKTNNLSDFLTDVANAIRTKTQTSEQINAQNFSDKILSIQTGGGGIEGGYNISYSVNGVITKVMSITPGDTIENNPFNPRLDGYAFVGWSLTEGGERMNFPYTPTGDTTIYALLSHGQQATVSNLGSSSPSSVTFQVDNGFPTSFEEVTFNGDVFIKIPTMYKKVILESNYQIVSFSIATAQLDSSYKPYPCFLDESGNLLPYVLIGKYWNKSSTTITSVASGNITSLTIGNARTYARNRGTGYQLYDWMFQRLWQDLIIVAMRTVNTNSGNGINTDALGFNWQSVGGWIDGITHTSGKLAVSYKPSKYVDSATTSTDGYVSIGYNLTTTTSSNQCISRLGYDVNNPFVNYPSATVTNESYNTYYCDRYSYSSGNYPLCTFVGSGAPSYGAFCYSAGGSWTSLLGVRLCYRPLAA